MSIYVKDIVYRAYRLCGVLPEPQRGYSTSEGTDGLAALNSMIGGFKAEQLMIWAHLRTVFDVVINKLSYTVASSGADLTLERPTRIEAAELIFTETTPNSSSPIRILTDQEYWALTPKDLTGSYPYMLYYQPTVPAGTLYLRPVPTQECQFALFTGARIDQFASLDTAVVLPPEYQEMLEYNLAVRLYPAYASRGIPLNPLVVDIARSSKGRIKSLNAPEWLMQCDRGALGTHQEATGTHYSPITNRWL